MNKRGFTLIEMIIIVIVVGILSFISVPLYKGHVEKAKLTEGYALLGALREAQLKYYVEYGEFLPSTLANGYVNYNPTCYSAVLNLDARSNKYFTIFKSGGSGAYAFTSFVYGVGTTLTMIYDKTAGVTVQ